MKQAHQPVNVAADANGHPSRLEGLKRPGENVRRVLDFWRYSGRWWLLEPPRDYYLLELETGHVFEVYRAGEAWVLSRIAD